MRLIVVGFVLWTTLIILGIVANHAWAASGDYKTYAKFDEVATTFAMRGSEVHCATPEDDVILEGSWGYTFLWANYTVIDNTLCDALNNARNGAVIEDWRAALAVLTILHESYHLRVWDLNGNEGAVECRAIRHWKVGARLLGLDEATIDRLFPWALAMHWRLVARNPQYRSPNCVVPNPY